MNKEYFNNIDTETKAYLLGFILADGWVTSNGRVLGLSVLSTDIDILLLLKKELDSEHKIQTRTKGRVNPLSRIEISCSALVTSLNKLGITSDKSLHATLPSIENSLVPHMLRGLFDGDGSFSSLRQPVIASSSLALLGDINKWLSSNKYTVCSIYTSNSGANASYKLAVNIPQSSVIDLMYKNANVYLPRKMAQYVEYTKLIASKIKGLE